MSKKSIIRVYASEKADGLEEKILSNLSVAFDCSVELLDRQDINTKITAATACNMKALAGEGVGDAHSLYYGKSIMVSTGKNKNDDVFLPEELWKARHTPEDKPLNYEHDQDDVIGHITGNYCIDAEGSVLDDATKIDEVPETFHIVDPFVLYKEWKTEAKQKRMDQIIKEIPEGKRSVSMECILTNFDYMLVENDGTEKSIASIVQRKQNTSYLTKHLRIYGGTGIYEGKKVMRVLRNITFSGKGLVTKPANPSSVILTDVEDVTASEGLVYISTNENKESLMATENTFEKENTELKAELEKFKTSAREQEKTSLKAQADKFQAEAKTLSDENVKLKTELENTSKTLKEVSTAKAEYEVALAKLETEKKTALRLNTVSTSLGLETEKAHKIVASLAKLDDTEFDSFIKTQAEYEAEKVAAYKNAMGQGGSVPTSGGDPMSKGGVPLKGNKPTEPTPLAVMSTPGASQKFAGQVVNLAPGTKAQNLPAGVTASETVDPAEVVVEETVLENAEPVKTPALAASVIDNKVELRRQSIANYMSKGKKESK